MSDRWFSKYQVDLPEGESGPWAVRRFTVSEADAKFEQLRAMIGGHGRACPAGEYTGIFRGATVWMSDTPNEIWDHISAIAAAQQRGGRVLINGLGLGMVAAAILAEPRVELVEVVEIDADVIKLVAPTLVERFGPRIRIIEGDAFTVKWRPGERWSVVWHDIWPTLCEDNLDEVAKLHRRYGRRCQWQGSWGRAFLQSERRRSKREAWF